MVHLRGHRGTRLLRSALSLESYGADELGSGPVLLAANHTTALDAAIVRAALTADAGRRMTLATTPGQAKQGLRHGRIVLVFPEGRPRADGELAAFDPGAFAPALALGLPVVPVAMRGAYAAIAPGQRWPTPGRPRVSVRFGGRLTGDSAEQFAVEARAGIGRLLSEDATSWWQVQRRGAALTGAPASPSAWRRIWQQTEVPTAGKRPATQGIWRS